jgi:tRNA1Val (adenine37-N6)-methyltransferase
MPNPYFQFKQFTIHQDRCSMKVATDSCILGAWFATKLGNAKTVLDIGAGTGLQMLMLAQQNAINIDGIELDSDSCQQCRENLQASKWKDQFEIYEGDARDNPFSKNYDFIICNPPFFEGDLTSDSAKKNLTRHSTMLNFHDLITIISKCLEDHGSFGLLLPYHRVDYMLACCAAFQFWPIEQLNIRQTSRHQFFRSIIRFSDTKPASINYSELIILDDAGKYTEDFVSLLKDYYLWL